MPSVEAQLGRIKRHAAEIIPERELAEKLNKSARSGEPLRVKLGLDPTAPDIHIGNAVPLHILRMFQNHGHHAILIIGDYTATIGDPSGQNAMRPQLSRGEVLQHAGTYLDQVGKIVDMDEAQVVHNSEWFAKMDLADVIRLAGKLTVARCLERDDFKKRLGAARPIGLHEMLYPLMQAYDSVKVESDIELGGTDQTFNILLGRDLQREVGMEPQVAVTNRLLVGLDGTEKMSKSKGNYIGINESPETMYGKAMSVSDDLMDTYFYLATDLPEEQIEGLLAGGTHPRRAKAELARAIVERYYGREDALRAGKEFDRVFRERRLPSEMPELQVPPELIDEGRTGIVQLVKLSGRAGSNSQARRLIRQGGVSTGTTMECLNTVRDIDKKVELDDGLILKIGKRHFFRVQSG